MAFEEAQTTFRGLLTGGSTGWRRVHVAANGEGPSSPSTSSRNEDIHIHRKGDVYRAMLDVPLAENDDLTVEQWRAILTTPEVRKEWDATVESNELLEMFDSETRIVKTKFVAGWPAKWVSSHELGSVPANRTSAPATPSLCQEPLATPML